MTMFATLTMYRVNPIFKDEFIACWDEFAASLKTRNMVANSTLHLEGRMNYIGYSVWTSKRMFEDIYNLKVPELKDLMGRFENYCNNIQVLHHMEVITRESATKS